MTLWKLKLSRIASSCPSEDKIRSGGTFGDSGDLPPLTFWLVGFYLSEAHRKPNLSSLKDWAAKKVTIFNSIVHLVKTSENILFSYLHFT